MFTLLSLTLSTLAFANSPCSTTPEQAAAFLKSKNIPFASIDQISTIDFGGNTRVTDEELVNLCGLKSLKSLYIYQDGVQDTSLTGRTLDQLSGLTGVTFLDLDSNRITADNLERLEGMSSLTALKLYNNPLAQNPRGLAGIEGLLKVPSLKTLVLQGSKAYALRDDDVPALAALADHPALETLDLTGNEISGRADFFQAVGAIKGLRKLDLTGVGLKRGADYSGLANSGLRNLRLGNNPMFAAGHNVVWAEDLRKLSGVNLKYLGLDATGVGAESLEVLGEMKTLEQIDLSYNSGVTAEGVMKLIEALPRLSCLKVDTKVLEGLDRTKIRKELELADSPIFNVTCEQ